MIYEIKNNDLVVKVNSYGAELCSIFGVKSKCEFLWQKDDTYWTDQSPVLFPFCGREYQATYKYKNTKYKTTLHGFAWHSEFNLFSKTDDSIELILSDSKESYENYPFKFEFIVGYKLIKNILKVTFKVINKDNKEIYFSYGGHPGFNCPINGEGNFEDYYLEFTKNEYKQKDLTDNVLLSGKIINYKLDNKKLHLVHSLFDHDAIFFEVDKDIVTLKSDKSKNYVKVIFDNMKLLGFWHMNKTNAPFVCFEPQFGSPGFDYKIPDIETKNDVTKLEKGGVHENSYSIEFYAE